MAKFQFPPRHSQPARSTRPRRAVSYAAVAVACVLIGMILAAQLDFSPRSAAQAPSNISETGMFPVVERDG